MSLLSVYDDVVIAGEDSSLRAQNESLLDTSQDPPPASPEVHPGEEGGVRTKNPVTAPRSGTLGSQGVATPLKVTQATPRTMTRRETKEPDRTTLGDEQAGETRAAVSGRAGDEPQGCHGTSLPQRPPATGGARGLQEGAETLSFAQHNHPHLSPRDLGCVDVKPFVLKLRQT